MSKIIQALRLIRDNAVVFVDVDVVELLPRAELARKHVKPWHGHRTTKQ
jgi:hypothetical protein